MTEPIAAESAYQARRQTLWEIATPQLIAERGANRGRHLRKDENVIDQACTVSLT